MEGFLQEAKYEAHCELIRTKTRLRTLNGLEMELSKATDENSHGLDRGTPKEQVVLLAKQRHR